ncbi:YafY family protein [Oscillospiraceae bacterium MB08-C2-2]|nr:YafY family protein [Oscillospiraceae bacterium MB08-C2-2]
MKNDRLFQLLYILLEKGSATAPELAQRLEVSVRTIYRDVEALSISGVPLYTTSGKNGGIFLQSGYTFDKALFSDEEQNQLLFSLQSLQAADQEVGVLLEKLGAVFQKQNTSWIEVDFSRWGQGPVDNQRFDLLKTAILQKRVLRIQYCGTSGEITEREMQPFKLIFKDKNWYLQAFCLKAEDFRLFKVNRITEFELTDQHFSEDFSEAPPPESTMRPFESSITLLLRFDPSVAFRIYDEFNQKSIKKQKDGSLLVTAHFPPNSWVISYLFSFGTALEVLEPAHLRHELAAWAKTIYMHHNT